MWNPYERKGKYFIVWHPEDIVYAHSNDPDIAQSLLDQCNSLNLFIGHGSFSIVENTDESQSTNC